MNFTLKMTYFRLQPQDGAKALLVPDHVPDLVEKTVFSGAGYDYDTVKTNNGIVHITV